MKRVLHVFTVMLLALCVLSVGNKAYAVQDYPTVYKGQDYSRVYDYRYYIKKYPSVKRTCKTKQAVLENFVKAGIPAKRLGNSKFDVKSYIYGNPDLRRMFRNDIAKYYLHYQNTGYMDRSRVKTAKGLKSMKRTWTKYNGIEYKSVYSYAYYLKKHPALKKKYMYDDYGLLVYYVTHDFQKGVAGARNVKSKTIKAVKASRASKFLSKTKTADAADQIILVVDHELTTWNKQASGTWKKEITSYCGYGSNGLAVNRYEGDRTTPIGAFPILFAFGKAENPGTAMEYRRVTPYSYYSGERATYNRWVESRVKIGGEHLTDYYQYEYAMSIGFNINPTVYRKGSAIFLHCKSNDRWSTAGCVSVPKATMKKIIQKAKKNTYIIIVKNDTDIAKY